MSPGGAAADQCNGKGLGRQYGRLLARLPDACCRSEYGRMGSG
ncbi:hypothetical protein LHK_01005 [Laribacter hongkongensis HLHK9]|uniref:Uncharacterized protein n=1 Tax=Laribacter hongkongensis (strain HLHK9) TaxID=557598 RepID=C1D5W7_LARHH|nr:hypothetical protein LHK_01005 [Laribacter hongkongensis HLHK9]